MPTLLLFIGNVLEFNFTFDFQTPLWFVALLSIDWRQLSYLAS